MGSSWCASNPALTCMYVAELTTSPAHDIGGITGWQALQSAEKPNKVCRSHFLPQEARLLRGSYRVLNATAGLLPVRIASHTQQHVWVTCMWQRTRLQKGFCKARTKMMAGLNRIAAGFTMRWKAFNAASCPEPTAVQMFCQMIAGRCHMRGAKLDRSCQSLTPVF